MSIFSSGGVNADGEVVSPTKPLKNYKNFGTSPDFVISNQPGMLVNVYAKNNTSSPCYLQFFDQTDPLIPGQFADRSWMLPPFNGGNPSLWLIECPTPALIGIQMGWSSHETVWNPVTINDTGTDINTGLPNPPEKIFHAVYA